MIKLGNTPFCSLSAKRTATRTSALLYDLANINPLTLLN